MDQSTRAPRVRPRIIHVSPRVGLFVLVLFAYLVLILGVVHWSPFLTIDRDVFHLDLVQHFPGWFYPLHTYVMLGQRAPATLVALPWFMWRAWKSQSPRPLLMLGTALVVLNLSVGVVKLAVGRLGPHATPKVHAVFEGGDIFPSGHVSNAVVLYGLIAMLAVSYRRAVIALAVLISFTVGLSTVYLDTHWVSDVFGGWIAGALVLIALPWVMPYVERIADPAIRWGHRRLRRVMDKRSVRGEPPVEPALAGRPTVPPRPLSRT